MKIRFDGNQPYQLNAVQSVTDIFEGLPVDTGVFNLVAQKGMLSDVGVANSATLDEVSILSNLQAIQKKNGILPIAEKLDGPHFSLEMETGTGKTYVYLRTIHELYKRYGFKKFIIVVPSIAIKEGVLKNLKITKEHFAELYENIPVNFSVYDPKKVSSIRNFSVSNTLQILVMNIDSFAKVADMDNPKKGNLMYRDNDKLSGKAPIEYIAGTNPIVIVDEPQNMETDKRKDAIARLNPLCTLRYSATHKHVYNLLYRLDPVQAYDQGLVKRIEVNSVFDGGNFNRPYVKLLSLSSEKNTITAKFEIDVSTAKGTERKKIVIKKSPNGFGKSGNDLYELSNNRDQYKNGFVINDLDVVDQSVGLSSGEVLYVGKSMGEMGDEVVKAQIRETIRNHFEKERILQGKGIKVLSLFFIDRVANYRHYDELGVSKKGKIAQYFEEYFKEIAQLPKYKGLIPHDVEKVHNGYFSQDKQGQVKDTSGATGDDVDTYELIMKEKERLLEINEPLRFIFSHSALREGWDNPNVFQICTLNESNSEIKKRQEIGRGMRLPVNQSGERIFDGGVNVLTVIANESYEDFARSLQSEIEKDCGVVFEKERIKNKKNEVELKLRKGYVVDETFLDIWNRIKQKTRYRVEFNTQRLIDEASREVEAMSEIRYPKIMSIVADMQINAQGIGSVVRAMREIEIEHQQPLIPDILGYIHEKTDLTKRTLFEILNKSGRLGDVFVNPQQFMDQCVEKINYVLKSKMIDGIKYEKIEGGEWEMAGFEDDELRGYLEDLVRVDNERVDKTLYNFIPVDSGIERSFAKELEDRDDIKFYFKLPRWFYINTPIGKYTPDWAVIFEGDKKLYFVVETKGVSDISALALSEQQKIQCGKKHFDVVSGVEFIGPIQGLGELNIN